MPSRQYSIGRVLYSEHYNFPVYIIPYLMFFCTYVYIYVSYVLWYACKIKIHTQITLYNLINWHKVYYITPFK